MTSSPQRGYRVSQWCGAFRIWFPSYRNCQDYLHSCCHRSVPAMLWQRDIIHLNSIVLFFIEPKSDHLSLTDSLRLLSLELWFIFGWRRCQPKSCSCWCWTSMADVVLTSADQLVDGLLTALPLYPKVLLEDIWPMITIPSYPNYQKISKQPS